MWLVPSRALAASEVNSVVRLRSGRGNELGLDRMCASSFPTRPATLRISRGHPIKDAARARAHGPRSSGIGSASMARDMGLDLRKPVEVMIDATAGIGVASRRGVGRIRHIHTPTLWPPMTARLS